MVHNIYIVPKLTLMLKVSDTIASLTVGHIVTSGMIGETEIEIE